MNKLLKTDLKRILKDKLFIVVCIIGVVLALLSPVLYKVLFTEMGEIEEDPLLSSFVSIKGLFFQSFSISNNFGLIVPILLVIIIFKDFSFGTVRNKIISGHSRVSIFLSMFLSSCIIVTIVIFAHAILTLLISLALFSNTVNEITAKEVGYFISSIGFELIVCIFVAALISFLSVFMKNVGLGIIGYVAIVMGITMLISGVMVAVELLTFDNGDESVIKFLQFILDSNIFYNSSYVIGMGETYSLKQVLYILLSSIIPTGLLVFLSIIIFNKKDIR